MYPVKDKALERIVEDLLGSEEYGAMLDKDYEQLQLVRLLVKRIGACCVLVDGLRDGTRKTERVYRELCLTMGLAGSVYFRMSDAPMSDPEAECNREEWMRLDAESAELADAIRKDLVYDEF